MTPATGPSAYLSWSELSCHDGTPYPLDYRQTRAVKLAEAFESIRFGRPRAILSAFRTVAYNTKIGGEPNSWHCQGLALDVAGGADMTLLAFALAIVGVAKRDRLIRGVGFYPDNGFVHLDCRSTKALALWRHVGGKMLSWTGEGFE